METKCAVIRVAHSVENLSGKEYPELLVQQRDLLDRIFELETAPFVSYKCSDFLQLLPTNQDQNCFVGINPYGQRCLVRQFRVRPEDQKRFDAAISFHYMYVRMI